MEDGPSFIICLPGRSVDPVVNDNPRSRVPNCPQRILVMSVS
jgi:hypothetical protein